MDYLTRVYKLDELKLLGDPSKHYIFKERRITLNFLAEELRKSALMKRNNRLESGKCGSPPRNSFLQQFNDFGINLFR